MKRALLTMAACSALYAQQAQVLTMEEAERIAIQNHPRIAAAKLATASAQEAVHQARSVLQPQVGVNMTGSVAEHGSTLGAGQLQPQALYSRTAAGVSVSQVVFDFGRAKSLTGVAEARASVQAERTNATRLEVQLRVRDAYYRVLQAQRQLKALQQNVELRALTQKQITALARSNLRSTLDVSFAELNLAEAELLLNRAENDVRASEVDFAASLGYPDGRKFTLMDPSDPPGLEPAPDELVTKAIANRPEVAAIRMQIQASRRQAESEGRQLLPSISLVGAGGYFGPRDERLHPSYGAAGVNVTIPVLTGGLFTSRRKEAELRAESETQEMRDLEVRIAREVRLAWVDADNARQRLAITAKVLDQAVKTLKLAQARYDLGLSSIVELGQAQLSRTSGEVEAAAARYEYLRRRNALDYQTGMLP